MRTSYMAVGALHACLQSHMSLALSNTSRHEILHADCRLHADMTRVKKVLTVVKAAPSIQRDT